MLAVNKMRHSIIILLVAFSWLQANFAKAQSQLEFAQNVFYSDSILQSSDSLTLRVALFNNSNETAERILVTYYLDSLKIDTLLFEGNLLSIPPKGTLDTIISFKAKPTFIGEKNNFSFEAQTNTASIKPAKKLEIAYIQVLPNEKAIPFFNNYVSTSFKRFNDYLPIEFELVNKGKVDYYSKKAINVKIRINNKQTSIVNFKMPNSPLLSEQRSTIKFKDSILVSNQFFKKGGGNIVVVWPVGFLQTDSIFDTLTVDWPTALNPNVNTDWFLYPNPASTYISIFGLDENIERVRLIDSKGQIYELNTEGENVRLPKLASGLYTLCFYHNASTYQRKLVIAN